MTRKQGEAIRQASKAMTLDTIFRQGVEWIAANAYTFEMSSEQAIASQPVQMLAELADVAPEWIVQCVDRAARNQPFMVEG